jgi:hypothetical protein
MNTDEHILVNEEAEKCHPLPYRQFGSSELHKISTGSFYLEPPRGFSNFL